MDGTMNLNFPRFRIQGRRTCDCCWGPRKTDYWHLCLNCDFRMCEDCFHQEHIRNPGHQIGRKVRATPCTLGTPPAASSRIIQSTEQHNTLVLDASHPSRDKWRCCSTCFNFTPDFISRDWNGPGLNEWHSVRKPHISHFKASAARGCELCSIIYRGALIAFPDVVAADSTVELHISMQALSVQVYTRGTWRFVDFHAMPGLQPKWKTLETKEYLSRSLQDPQSFDRIRSWLKACETNHDHPICRQKAESPLPTRVITIQPTTGLPQLHLYKTNGETEKYLALSHCWGGFKGCQTTTSNYTHRIDGIEFSSLPQTFQDAVVFAMQISVFHIWIDSLCIIQDDKSDWELESTSMAKVYSNAYLVLAAASADADDRGFFTTPESIYRGVALESQEGSGRDDLVMHTSLGPQPGRHSFPSASLSPVDLGPLETRAWTLQETMLARRCIGFNEKEIAWECHVAIDCECGSSRETSISEHASTRNTSQIRRSNWTYKVCRGGIFGESSFPRFHCRPLSHFANRSTTYLEWRMMIIPNYTRRQLTFPGDKLPALSALANSLGKWSGDQYLAGIWLADIKLGLAWRVGWQETQLPAPSKWIGPSFSWASVNGNVDYILPDEILKDDNSSRYGSVDVNVLEHRTEMSGLNPYGAVNSSWVKLSALSQTLSLQWDSTERSFALTNESEYPFERSRFHPDTLLCESRITGPKNEEYVSVLRSISRDNTQASFNICVIGALILDVPNVPRENHSPMVGSSRFSHVHEIAIMVLGLFSVNPDKYQRIGLATVSFGPESAEKWLGSLTRKEFIVI